MSNKDVRGKSAYKNLETALQDSLSDLSNDEKASVFSTEMCALLSGEKAVKPSAKLIGLVVKGMPVDRGIRYFEYLEERTEQELKDACRLIESNTEIRSNQNGNGLRFLCAMFGTAFFGKGEIAKLTGFAVTRIMNLIREKKIPAEEYDPIIKDYFIDDLTPDYKNPAWNDIKAEAKDKKEFAEILLHLTEEESLKKEQNRLRQWLKAGILDAEKKIEHQALEDKIPKSRVKSLQDLAAHYQGVEQLLREQIYENHRKEKELEALNSEAVKLRTQKSELELQVQVLKKDAEKTNEQLKDARQEARDRKDIHDAFEVMKKKDEAAALKDIASDLKPIYSDFEESLPEQVDAELGEIYRDMIENIFKILKRKGIQVK